MLAGKLCEVIRRSKGSNSPFPFLYEFDSSLADILLPLAGQARNLAQSIQKDHSRIIEDGLSRTSIGLWAWDCGLRKFTGFIDGHSMLDIRSAGNIAIDSIPEQQHQAFAKTANKIMDERIGELPELLDCSLYQPNGYTKIPKDQMAIEARLTFDYGTNPLLPHTDSGRKIFSLILPLTLPTDCLEFEVEGTCILKPRIPGLTSFTSNRYPQFLFRPILETKHEIGHFLIFRKTNNSWHAVYPKRRSRTNARISLLINIVKK